MANTLYRAAVRELEGVLSPRLASQSLHEGLLAAGKTADTLLPDDAETILRNRVLPRLTLSLGETKARAEVEGILGRLAEVAAEEGRALDLAAQRAALRDLQDALRPFNVSFEWAEVQEARAQLALAEREHAAGRDASRPVADARALLGTLKGKLRDQLEAQAQELAQLEAAHRELGTLNSPKLRRLGGLLDVVRASQAAQQQAPAEVARAHALVAELRAAQAKRSGEEAQALRELQNAFADLLTLEPEFAGQLAALQARAAGGVPLGDALPAVRAELETRQEALRRALLEEFGERSDAQPPPRLLAATLAALATTLPSAADVRRLRDLRRGSDLTPEHLADFHRLEADAGEYRAGPGGAGGPLHDFLAAARQELETNGSLPDLTPGRSLLAEARSACEAQARRLEAWLEAVKVAAAPLSLLNSDEALALRWQLQALTAQWAASEPSELEAGLREVEALVERLQNEADATRAVASGLLSGGSALDEALGVFDLFDAPASALPSSPALAPNVSAAQPTAPHAAPYATPYEAPYAALQGWLERQLEGGYIAGLALFTENADTLVVGTLPTATKTLARAVRLARRRANALGDRLAQGAAASLAVETQGYTMLVFWLTRTRSLALVTHAPTWRGAARQSVEDALPELIALLQTPVPS